MNHRVKDTQRAPISIYPPYASSRPLPPPGALEGQSRQGSCPSHLEISVPHAPLVEEDERLADLPAHLATPATPQHRQQHVRHT
jgi:hypothetical protein